MPDIDTTSIRGLWVHSHEEDQPGTQVFRHSSYPFPRSRGRTSYELRPDGTLGGTRPGPDDRHVAAVGRWDLQGSRLTITPEAAPSVHYNIEKVEADRMLVKPVLKP